MDPLLAALMPLARLEETERRLLEDVRQHTRRLAAASDAAQAARDAVAALEAEIAAHNTAMPPLEAELKAVQERRDRARLALDHGQIAGETAERQLRQLAERIGELEDTLLAHLDTIEALEGRLTATLAERDAALVADADAQAHWTTPRRDAEANLEGIDTERLAFAAALPASERTVYHGRRARRTYALSEMVDGVCASCHTQVPVQARGDLKAGRVISCASCSRWLYVGGT